MSMFSIIEIKACSVSPNLKRRFDYEIIWNKVKQRGEDYEHDNRCACQNGVRRTHLRTLARESIEDVKILIEELRNNGYEA